jgi:hypothetical protein
VTETASYGRIRAVVPIPLLYAETTFRALENNRRRFFFDAVTFP